MKNTIPVDLVQKYAKGHLKWWEYQTNVKIYSSTTVVEHTEENGRTAKKNGRGHKPMQVQKHTTHTEK
jgi:hypothetical protein